ncbi:Calcium-transporting ATPase type 2C member 1, partial [Fragariocoptes setiger]
MTNFENGLSSREANDRLRYHGPNEFKCEQSQTLLSKYLDQFKNPLIILLLVSALISILMQQYDDALSITVAIVIVVTVAFVQEYRSEQSLQELNKLVPPTCKCLRDGQCQSFLARNLVPGDVVLLAAGDRVPADIRLFECCDLTIDESSLTGETEAVAKSADPIDSISYNVNGKELNSDSEHHLLKVNTNLNNSDQNLSSTPSVAYMGTLVRTGNGKGIVISTGVNAKFGQVFSMMQAEEAPKSPLQKNMDQLGQQLSIYSFGIVIMIILIGWLQSRPMLEMFTVGVSLAVAAIPEGLPIVVTVTLALGVMRMAKRKAIVKKLPVVETLGSVHVICSDKTGTITKNEMTVSEIITSEFYEAYLTGVGYAERGDIRLRENTCVSSRLQEASIRRLLKAACLCNNASLEAGGKLLGQATEGALIVAGNKAGLNHIRDDYVRLREVPFNSESKLMSVQCVSRSLVSNGGYQSNLDDPPVHFVKGAIECVICKCKTYSNNGLEEYIDNDRRASYVQTAERLGMRGLRVISVASGTSMEKLCFLGMAGIYDPPREGVQEAIRILNESGVSVKMVTGDAETTASAIARDIGLLRPGLSVMSGKELDMLMDSNHSHDSIEIADRLNNVAVFYRVSPAHKVNIVKAFQARGMITAMTGDGVNDVVALKKADIGIAMGLSGTDVCKEAADMILLDDNLATIMSAIEEGKGIFYNIRNFIRFQLSTSIAALTLIAISTLLHIPNPLNAMQILWINIIMDGPPAQSLGLEPVDRDVLKRPPRDVREPVITRELIVNILVSASVIICGTLLVFVAEMSDNVVTPRDTTMTFTCFVLFDMFNAMGCRSQYSSYLKL